MRRRSFRRRQELGKCVRTMLSTTHTRPWSNEIILVGMEMMFIVGGAILLFLGLFVTATRRLTIRIK